MNGKQLKNSILQLAIQGKLVPQDSNDEPASVLLQHIRKEKEQLVKEGKLKKKDLVTTPISDEEKPFEIPESWVWCRLKNICSKFSTGPFGTMLHKEDYTEKEGIPLVNPTDIRNSSIDSSRIKRVNIEKYKELVAYRLEKNDIVLARRGDLSKIAIVKSAENGWVAGTGAFFLHILQLSLDYFKLFYVSNYVQQYLLSDSIGTTMANLNQTLLGELLIPLPPLSEQHRIVAKIEELMPLVEEYDKAQMKLEDLNAKLPDALKKSILQEAIMGKLVAQDPNDEPASVLLQRIRKEKEQLVKEGKLKKKDLVSEPIADEEKPFDIPESWVWCRLNDIGLFERGSGIKRDETRTEGYPCVRYGEMYTSYRKNPTFDRTISFTTKEVFDKCRKAHKGDLFMALTGENKQDIALAAQYIGDEEVAVGGDLCHFTVLESYALYFVYLINSPYYSSKKELLATGDIIVHISADKLGSIPIPLPPLSEQHRIVAKIEELFGILK